MRPTSRSRPRLAAGRVIAGSAALLVALAMSFVPVSAQNNITGTVVDGGTQRPLGGAQVLI